MGSYTSPGGLTLYFVPAREASELGKDRAGGLIVGDKVTCSETAWGDWVSIGDLKCMMTILNV